MEHKIRLGIIDDDLLIVSLLKSFFDKSNCIQVTYITTDGSEFISQIEECACTEIDVLLLDLKMKTIDGLEVLKYVKSHAPNLKVIVISSHYQQQSIGFMTKEGASGFLPKGISPFDLQKIIKFVHKNGFYLNNEQMGVLRQQISHRVYKPKLPDEETALTEREVEIIKLLCSQKTAKEIGEILFITQRTVEGHKNNLFSKIGVRNISGLIIYALQKQIVTLEELSV